MNLNDFYAYQNEQDTLEKRKFFYKFINMTILDSLSIKKIVPIELDNPNYNKSDIDDLLMQCLNSDFAGKMSGESVFVSTKDFYDQNFYIKDDSGSIVLKVDADAETINYMGTRNPLENEKDFLFFQTIVDWLKDEVSNVLVFS